MTPRAQGERDAATAESTFALMSGLLPAVFGVAWVLHVEGPARAAAAWAAAGTVLVWRVTAVLWRHDADRRRRR